MSTKTYIRCEEVTKKDDDNDDDYQTIGFLQYLERSLNMIHPKLWLYITSLFIALILVLLIRPVVDNLFPLFVIIMSILVFVIRDSMTGSNIVGSLPKVTTPRPPHLGLDGVSLENRYPYQYV